MGIGAEGMRFATVRRLLPRPLKRRLKLLAGRAYAAERLLRRRARPVPDPAAALGGDGAGARAGQRPGGAVVLPAGALDCVLGANRHGIYCVPWSSHHRPVAQAILQARVWEADTLDLIRMAAADGDVIHAGTFFGDFLPALSRSRAADALIWAFEPSRESYRCAQVTALLNDLRNVKLMPAGLGAASGSARLAVGDRSGTALGGASRLIKDPSRARWWSSEEVDMIAVDGVVGEDRSVAVVHLDVEGHEQDALAGAMGTIARCRPLIVLETMPAADWLAANLEPLGYRQESRVDRNFVLRCR